ncbi:MAG: class I SAM-dependent methyltransferase [Alphaproteobacteria bacterium]|nr:class I SAM-dependent methyltransferase [Alphaproteobacteria bacterium]
MRLRALSRHEALVDLGCHLKSTGYSFRAPTPATHALVNARPENQIARSLTDIFGWGRPFRTRLVSEDILTMLEAVGAIETSGDLARSLVRYSTLDNLLFVHSAYPTNDNDAVFFGPDTYRFARLLGQKLGEAEMPGSIIDIGCGSGAGGIFAVSRPACRPDVVLSDVNEHALSLARVNAELNGVRTAQFVRSDVLSDVEGCADLIIANPPYLCDPARRLYRHGGERGFELSQRIVEEGVARLNANGRLILYTASPVVDAVDQFFETIEPYLMSTGNRFVYEEIDPDVFGEELTMPAYAHVDRISVVALTVFAAGA